MHFTFQESHIWEGGKANRPDPKGKKHRVKAKSVERAKRRLPKNSSVGRNWVLIKVDE